MKGARQVLNGLRWHPSYDLREAEIWYRHRGATNDEAGVQMIRNDSLVIISLAIGDVSSLRATLGAFQCFTLESNMNSLMVASENLVAAESVIRDVDMASEMAEYTKQQIMMQAGVAMLGQANMIPQSILSLLQ